jgi:MYXO-CTERM domain-containing protein
MRTTCGTWRSLLALTVALAACGPAQAFYFPGWPEDSRFRPQESPIIPRSQPPVTLPPLIPGDNEKPPVGPNATPEPSTGLIGLLGLGAIAAARRWRRFAAK